MTMSSCPDPGPVLGASDLLSRDEIRAFTRTSDLPGFVSIAWTWAVIAGTFAALALWPHPVTVVAAVIVLGGRQLALAVLMHEAAHGTLFRTRFLNEVVTDWLCARPIGADVARYRKHHLAHHAHTGTARDPDLGLALPRPMTRGSLARKILRDLSGASGVRRVLGLVAIDAGLLTYNVGGRIERAPFRGVWFHASRLARQAWKAVLCNTVMFGTLWLLGVAWVYLVWLAAYLTTFSLFIRWRSLAEHAVMARGPDPLRNTRTTRAGVLARVTVAPLHVNLHLEHHLLPTVPWYRLPALHRLLRSRDAIPPTSHAPGYLAVLRAVSR